LTRPGATAAEGPSRPAAGMPAPVRRPTRFIIAAALIVLLCGLGGYVAYWRYVAQRIEAGLVAWQQSESKHKIEASWQRLRVGGFPFAFRIELDQPVFRDLSRSPPPELRLARLSGAARPWDFADWRLDAPGGFTAELAAAGKQPAVELTIKSARGTVAIGDKDTAWIWLGMRDLAGRAAVAVPVRSADAWILLPAKPAVKDTDPSFGLAVDLRQVGISEPPVNFGKIIDELALGMTVKGPFPTGPLAQAAARWRDAGGTIEVENLRLDWSGLGITANGTLALDRKLQPMAAFSGGIEGFGAILEALVVADQLTPEQASLVGIALTSLAKPGPDGKPQITAPFTIQNGKMYLGPARLGAAPRIVWE
jgi:hypothetical protein